MRFAVPPRAGNRRREQGLARRWEANRPKPTSHHFGAVFAGMRSDPELPAVMRRLLRRDQASMTDQPFALAAQRGETLAPRAAQLFAEIAPAVIVHQLTLVGEPCDRPFLEHLVDDVLLPLLQPRHDRTRKEPS